MTSSKKLTCKGQVFICLRPPPLLGFCLGFLEILKVLNLIRYRELKTPAEYGLQQD